MVLKTAFTVVAMMVLNACGGASQEVPLINVEYLDVVELCGNPNLLGQEVEDINGAGACGIDNPVRVMYVAGVELSTPATLNCRTANTLAGWVATEAQDAVKNFHSRINRMRVMASYSCRTRNSRPGARLSEHALGNAIDIGSFTLANGVELSVEEDWGQGKEGAALRRLHDAACGPFGTVLGPESDRYHYNHFHLDTAEYRSGSYCR